jgi:oligosaccharide repeat unit polymerase
MLGIVFTITMAAWAVITIQEGIPIFSPDVASIRVALPDRHHVLYQLEVIGCNFLLPLIFLYKWTARPPKQFKFVLWGASIILLFVLISQGDRGLVLPPLIAILIMRHLLVKPFRLVYVVPFGLAMLLALGVAGYDRSLQLYGNSFIETQISLGVPPALQPYADIYFYIRAPLSTFRDVTQMIPAVDPYQWGRLSFGAITQILPGRHPSSDFFFKNLLNDTFVGFGEPATMLGTFYADFGPLGILFGMGGIGFLTAYLYREAIRTARLHWILIYAYLLQKLIGGMYGSFVEYFLEILLPVSWFLILKYYLRPNLDRVAEGTSMIEKSALVT